VDEAKDIGMKTIWYSSESDCRHPLEVTDRCDMTRPREQKQVAEECAQDFHSNHDGWECRWPREFELFESEDGPAVAKLLIERESVPLFTAHAC
jgi:hypothetical protein